MNKPSHQRGKGLLYSSRSSSHTCPVRSGSPVAVTLLRPRAVHHSNHMHATMLMTVNISTNQLTGEFIIDAHPVESSRRRLATAAAQRNRNPVCDPCSMPTPTAPRRQGTIQP